MFFYRFENKIKKAKTAVVAIGFIRRDDRTKISIIGSGFVISKQKNLIVSCHHIIDQRPPVNFDPRDLPNLRALVFIRQDGRIKYYDWFPIKLVQKDRQNDVALYKIESLSNTLMGELRLGNSSKVKEGNKVYFIGYPYAALLKNEGWGYTQIVNTGIISNVKLNQEQNRILLIVDAINNPGNSGCPLILRKNNLAIGIMTNAFRKKSEIRKYKDLDIMEPTHFGGARPINFVKRLLTEYNKQSKNLIKE